jgi:hypothetical protein
MTSRPDPFVPVERVLVADPDRGPDGPGSKCYSVRRDDPESDKGWRELGMSPPGHLFVTNQELCRMADEIAQHSPYDWDGVRLFFDGKRFAYGLRTTDVFEDVGGREALCAGLVAYTSYDGSWATGCRLFAYRPVSTAGLLHGGHFGQLRFRRPLTSETWDRVLERGWGYIDGAEEKLRRFGAVAHKLKRRALNSTDLADLRRGPLAGWPTPLWGQLLDRYLDGVSKTAWDLLTRGTALLWNESERPPVASEFRHNQVLTEAIIGAAEDGQGGGMAPWLR